ncbi:hypothetical protein ACQBAR_08965 [Propionibacteriaceae bacterium Y1685]|uniref:hypothetical protein n=1 Tax=Microlunatus sp. Y1700 TaxID=3418487 RepID=UPI003B77FE75
MPTRLVGGEAVASYSQRHASRNFSTAKEIEKAAEEQGFSVPGTKSASERVTLWRDLGGLHERAFTEPQIVAGNWVIERPLCERCAPAHERARGRLPRIGMVCVRHKRWLGQEQVDVAPIAETIVAERHWRRLLTPCGIVVECPVVLLAEEAATVGISKAVLEERAQRVAVPSPALLVYPETVRLARLLTRPSFLDAVLGDATAAWKRTMVEREVGMVLPDAEDAENWRAVARVWDLVLGLQDVVRDARLLGTVPEDRWNVLRLWSGFAEFEAVEVSRIDQLM